MSVLLGSLCSVHLAVWELCWPLIASASYCCGGSDDHTVQVWDYSHQECLQTLSSRVLSLLSGDEFYLLTTSYVLLTYDYRCTHE
eukprot:2165008-Amphidinium_carterae.1